MIDFKNFSADKIEAISIHSDFYKDVNGIRPRWMIWDNVSVEEINLMIDELAEECKIQMEEETAYANKKAEEFKTMLLRYQTEFGAQTEEIALQWYLDGVNEKFYSSQCVEQLIWNEGFIFTEYGKEIYRKLANLATYQK